MSERRVEFVEFEGINGDPRRRFEILMGGIVHVLQPDKAVELAGWIIDLARENGVLPSAKADAEQDALGRLRAEIERGIAEPVDAKDCNIDWHKRMWFDYDEPWPGTLCVACTAGRNSSLLVSALGLFDDNKRYLDRIAELTEQSNHLYGIGQEYDELLLKAKKELASCRQAYLKLEAVLLAHREGIDYCIDRDVGCQSLYELAGWQRERLRKKERE